MIIKRTPEFARWLRGLDAGTMARIAVRIDRMERGNPGDVAPIGCGLSEMRIHFGAGYRVYFRQRGDTVTILCGGDKGSQENDIRKARAIAEKVEE